MIVAQVAALNNLLRSHDAGAQAMRVHPTSQSDSMHDERDMWEDKTLCQARFASKNIFCSALPGESRDGRMGRFTHSEKSVRAGGDQGLEDRDEESTDEDDEYETDGPQVAAAGNGDRTTEGHEEGRPFHPTTSQLPRENLDLLQQISDTEARRLALDSERLTAEIRAVAATGARVAQETRRLVMDEAKILALTESDTHKWTDATAGYFETVVLFVQRNGLDDAAVIQSDKTCADGINRMRLNSKVETGGSVLFKTPIVAENETLLFSSAISERVIVLGRTGRFGRNEPLNLVPMDMIPLCQFERRSIKPFGSRIKTPPNPTGEPPNA